MRPPFILVDDEGKRSVQTDLPAVEALPHVITREPDIAAGATPFEHAMALRASLERAAREVSAEALAAGDAYAALWWQRYAARIAPPR